MPPSHGRSFSSEERDVITETREALCRFIGCRDSSRLIFSSGATESLNWILLNSGLAGKHIVTTPIEHNAVLRSLKVLEDDHGSEISYCHCDTNGVVEIESILEVLRSDTAAVVVNYSSNVTGAAIDIQTLGSLLKERGITFLVDASQGIGLLPIDVEAAQVDALVFAGHKFLYGIPGTGGAYIRPGFQPDPYKYGGTGFNSASPYLPAASPERFEAGTLNYTGISSLNAGIEFIEKRGIVTIRKQLQNWVHDVLMGLEGLERIKVRTARDGFLPGTLFSFEIEGMDLSDVSDILTHSYGFIVREGLHCAPMIHRYLGFSEAGSIRISPSVFSTESDAKNLIDALKAIHNTII